MGSKPLVACDLDGVLASWTRGTFDRIGDPIPGAREFLARLSRFATPIIHTCRLTPSLYPGEPIVQQIEEWMERNGFPRCKLWTAEGKPHVKCFVDDQACFCRPEEHGERAYTAALATAQAMVNEQRKKGG